MRDCLELVRDATGATLMSTEVHTIELERLSGQLLALSATTSDFTSDLYPISHRLHAFATKVREMTTHHDATRLDV